VDCSSAAQWRCWSFYHWASPFFRHPDFFFGHASEVSVFADRVSGARSPLLLLGENALRVLGMFSFVGDSDWTHGMAGRPVLDWAISILFMIGVVVWIGRLFGWRRTNTAEGTAPPGDPDVDALALLALWAVTMLAPSVLSEAAPNYSRTLPSLPAALLPIGLGLTWIVIRPWPRRWIGPALAGAIIAASAVITVYDYFVRFPQMREVYYVYEVDKADALAILKERGREQVVYFSPLWGRAPTRALFPRWQQHQKRSTLPTLWCCHRLALARPMPSLPKSATAPSNWPGCGRMPISSTLSIATVSRCSRWLK
jgi:hypothetical protein